MKEEIRILFSAGDLPWRDVERALMRSGLVKDAKRGPSPVGIYSVTLPANGSELQALKESLGELGVDWSERRKHTYTIGEVRTAPLSRLAVRRKEAGFGGPTYGTIYDLSRACPVCGTGARQTSPLRLEPDELPKTGAIFQTLDHEVLVSPELAGQLNELSGVELRQAQVRERADMLPWYQIIPTDCLPPMDARTKGLERFEPCPACGRDGYYMSEDPLEIWYEADQLPEPLADFYSTWEHLGRSRLSDPFETSGFAAAMILVSPRAAEILLSNARGLEFVPVTLG